MLPIHASPWQYMGTLFNLAKAVQQLGEQERAQELMRQVLAQSKGVSGGWSSLSCGSLCAPGSTSPMPAIAQQMIAQGWFCRRSRCCRAHSAAAALYLCARPLLACLCCRCLVPEGLGRAEVLLARGAGRDGRVRPLPAPGPQGRWVGTAAEAQGLRCRLCWLSCVALCGETMQCRLHWVERGLNAMQRWAAAD